MTKYNVSSVLRDTKHVNLKHQVHSVLREIENNWMKIVFAQMNIMKIMKEKHVVNVNILVKAALISIIVLVNNYIKLNILVFISVSYINIHMYFLNKQVVLLLKIELTTFNVSVKMDILKMVLNVKFAPKSVPNVKIHLLNVHSVAAIFEPQMMIVIVEKGSTKMFNPKFVFLVNTHVETVLLKQNV